jgi:putative nucleotidyltransferase with HDIG domain
MQRKDFDKLKKWFEEYTSSFHSDIEAFQVNIELKRDHSFRVWKNAAELAKRLNTGPNDQLLIETAALFHDVGRFEQFRQYGTFSDKKSVNHAWLSTNVIQDYNLLQGLTESERQSILDAIYNHNKKEIAGNLPQKPTFFVKVLRDADKLDIWKVVTDYYCNTNGETNNTLQLDLPDTPGYNHKNYEDLKNQKMADLNNLQNLNDFKLLQIGWVYDLNFKHSIELARERKYLQIIFDSLPQSDEIQEIKNQVTKYMES